MLYLVPNLSDGYRQILHPLPLDINFDRSLHSHKILTKQQGWPRGVGNPLQALTGFNLGSLAT